MSERSEAEQAVRRPVLRVVSGDPTPEELAVVTAVVTAAAGARSGPERRNRGRWNDPFDAHRGPWLVGPGAWRSSLR